jgi:hypothetical protein
MGWVLYGAGAAVVSAWGACCYGVVARVCLFNYHMVFAVKGVSFWGHALWVLGLCLFTGCVCRGYYWGLVFGCLRVGMCLVLSLVWFFFSFSF